MFAIEKLIFAICCYFMFNKLLFAVKSTNWREKHLESFTRGKIFIINCNWFQNNPYCNKKVWTFYWGINARILLFYHAQ